MMKRPKRRVLSCVIATFALYFIAGCSPTPSSESKVTEPPEISETARTSQTSRPSQIPQTSTSVSNQVSNQVSIQATDIAQTLLIKMKELAKQGKVINSDFPVKTMVIEDVIAKLGKPDKVDWVPEAKGNYATFSSHNLVFGFNKGSQIFEVRSFDQELQKLSLSKTKEVYGNPVYKVDVNGEKIIGYTVGEEFKLELVFPEPTSTNPDPLVDHYLVLYPYGTVNYMADDLGRQW